MTYTSICLLVFKDPRANPDPAELCQSRAVYTADDDNAISQCTKYRTVMHAIYILILIQSKLISSNEKKNPIIFHAEHH